jgi:hypothetical protein
MRRTSPVVIPAAITALIISGCGITDPYRVHRGSPPPQTSSATTAATATTPVDPSERPAGSYPPGQLSTGPTGPTRSVQAGAITPEAALERYAQIDTNWTATTLARTQQQLAQVSLGAARANALQAAASYGHDPILLHSHVTNTGAVVAISAGKGPAAGQWVVVTSERTTGTGDYVGLPAQLHVTYARLVRANGGWEVSAWSPRT